MNNTNYNNTIQTTKKITDLNADVANEFVKSKLFCFDERANREKALITTSQIRKFLSAVNCLENKISSCGQKLEPEIANEIKYLKVKLAYQVGRDNKNRGLRNLYDEIEPLISQIGTSKDNYTKVARYIEAIVAYHKFNGGE